MYASAKRTGTTARAYARAALVGNPSDGYGGRTLAYTFLQLHADVAVKPAGRLVIEASGGEGALLRAAAGRFAMHCIATGRDFAPCSIGVRSSIPGSVGLAGSSAIVVAALRALCTFNEVEVAETELPGLALAAEEDLGIAAGLQDRVAQVYEGLVYMDFDREHMAEHGHGRYEQLDPELLPQLYVAWKRGAAVSSSEFHGELRRRFREGDQAVAATVRELAELAGTARDRLLAGDTDGFGELVDANFDLRRNLGALDPSHVRMVEAARAAGASANYAGSGGAITGLVSGPEMLAELRERLEPLGCTVIQPDVPSLA